MFWKKGFETLQKSQENNCAGVSFNKVASFQKKLKHRYCEFLEFSNNTMKKMKILLAVIVKLTFINALIY